MHADGAYAYLRPKARATWGALGLFLSTLLLVPLGATTQGDRDLLPVIVQGSDDSGDAARAVIAAGGRVERRLPIADGVAASVPRTSISALRSSPHVRSVTPNSSVSFEHHLMSYEVDDHRVQSVVRSDETWTSGYTGRGITVAIVDTGIHSTHPDLQGRVIACVDYSAEASTSANCEDSFGHGTFMAGLVGGNGTSSGGRYMGAAPDARLVSVKVAGADGSTDVSGVLAAIQWVVAHRNLYDIRVMNLSLGTDSTQDYRRSPLNFAVEKAWQAGVAVMVSGGNAGPGSATISKPADDPYVITVGSSDDQGTVGIEDDTIPTFSSRGPTRSNGFVKPDVVAPGVRTVSLRAPGSTIDLQFGQDASIGTDYFRGTGTSMSAATVSGVVAQMLEASPGLTPDQVKFRLMATARDLMETDPNAAGEGVVDAYAAATTTLDGVANQGLAPGQGTGSMQQDRGTAKVDIVLGSGQAGLSGEVVAATDPSNPSGLLAWAQVAYPSTGWDATSWKATSWKATSWKATSFATSWKGSSWNASSWKGTDWSNADWNATSWKGVHWDATSWKATSWKSVWYAAAWE